MPQLLLHILLDVRNEYFKTINSSYASSVPRIVNIHLPYRHYLPIAYLLLFFPQSILKSCFKRLSPILQPHVFLIKNQFISNLVLDTLKSEKLLELQRKSQETLEISVLFQSIGFGKHISSKDLTSVN